MSTFSAKPNNDRSELDWDAFVASLHRVWEYAPDFSPTGPVNLSGRKFLVVDHDAEHNTQLAERLKRIGSSPIVVVTIGLAVRELEQHKIDLVVLAMNFLNDDALQFCRTLSDTAATMNIPVIMLSEDDRPEMIWAARRAGATFYLRKPYDPYVLLALMSAALEPTE
jgi:DNA-binding response OmpR family regulator